MEHPTLSLEIRELLFASSQAGWLLLRPDGMVRDLNSPAADWFGTEDVTQIKGGPVEALSSGAGPSAIAVRRLRDSLNEWNLLPVAQMIHVDRPEGPSCFHLMPVRDEEALGFLVQIEASGDEAQAAAGVERAEPDSFLQLVLNSIPIAVFWKDRQLKFLGCNERFAEDAGFESPLEVVGKTDADMPWDAEDCLAYQQDDQRVMKERRPRLKILERQRRSDARDAWVETNKVPIHGSSGEVIGILGSYEEVTERIVAEQSLQEFSDGLHLMAEATADKVGQPFFDSCVASMARLLDMSVAVIAVPTEEEGGLLQPKSLWHGNRLIHSAPIDLKGTPLADAQSSSALVCVSEGVRERYPENQLLRDFHAEAFVGLPITEAGGDICAYFFALDPKPREKSMDQVRLIMDLFAPRVSVEIERSRGLDNLQREVERATLLEGISRKIRASFDPDEIVQSAISGLGGGMKVDRCLIFNHHTAPRPELVVSSEYLANGVSSAVETELGIEDNDFMERLLESDAVLAVKTLGQDIGLGELTQALRSQGVRSIMAVRTSYQNEVNGALMVQQCSGERDWTREDEDLLKAVADMVGIALGQAKLFENERLQRHELARKNRALAKAKADADAANYAKSEFLSRMSHELRTPLNAILGFAQVMARDALATDQQRQNLKTITRSGTHLLEMINDVLEMSRIEAGKVNVDPSTFNLEDLLDSVISMFQAKVHPDVKLKLGIAPTVPVYARTDAVKLRQILINLFGNAVKFTTQGEVSLRVRAEQRYPDGISSAWNLIVSVCDTGPGIREDEMDRLFQPFSQTESGEQLQQGTGLGMPISRQFARLLGGDIAVESEYGEGTIVTVKIPCGEADPAELDDRRLEASQRAVGLMPGQEPPSVLIVDDHEESRNWLDMLLSSIGFQPVIATNGAEALDSCEKALPKVIFMDIHMPVMDGDTAAAEIRKRYGEQGPLLVALTASAFTGEHERVTNGPFELFLAKPVHEKSLVEVFEAHLGVVFDYGAEVEERNPVSPIERRPAKARNLDLASAGTEARQEGISDEDPAGPSEPLCLMPGEWLDELEEATACLNLNETQTLLRSFEERFPKDAEPLLQWCEEFQFDRLQAKLREAREAGYATQ